MKSYREFDIDIPYRRTSGNIKTYCPKCKDRRHNKRDKSLSVSLDKGIWHCHYCGWSGTIKESDDSIVAKLDDKPRKEYKRPAPRPMTDLSANVVKWFNNRGISEWVLKKMRISEGECFLPQVGTKRNTIQFCYYLNDELINVKYRDGAKNFMLERDAELIPYNIDNIADKTTCIITEGEMDCLSFVEIGKLNCISVPNGANKNLSYLDDFVDGWFEDKETIYIAVDTDRKGLELRDELVRRFGSERCKIVTYGEGCKDANEHLIKYGKESLQHCLSNAKDVKVDGVFTLLDYEVELDDIFLHGLKSGYNIGHPNFDALCTFETKRLAVVTGVPGSGKSEFIDEMCVRMNYLHNFKVGFFSPENMPIELHAVKLIEKITGRKLQQDKNEGMLRSINKMEYDAAKEYVTTNFFHILPSDGYTIDNILAKARYLVRKHGIRILVIDPYNRIENGQNRGENETQYISRVLDSLTNFAQQNDILIFLMAHPRKIKKDENGGVPTLYDINGSANFFNKADFGIVVHRYRDDKYTLVRVEKVKFRHLGRCGDAKFRFSTFNGRYSPIELGDKYIDVTNFITEKQKKDMQGAVMPLEQTMQPSTPPPQQQWQNPFGKPIDDNDLSFLIAAPGEETPF